MKTFFCCLLAALAGLGAGLLIHLYASPDDALAGNLPAPAGNETTIPLETTPLPPVQQNTDLEEPTQLTLLDAAYTALFAFRDGDYIALAALAHPIRGVTFTPYSTVGEGNLSFTPLQLSRAATDDTRYIWGLVDGSAAPIQLTMRDYFARYVYNAPYDSADILGLDRVISSGNSLENVTEAYPQARFVEFYLSGSADVNQGMDWAGLKLVFEPYLSEYYLTGVIHSEWTT